MIDLHAHVLPGIDDGPETLEETVDLARAATGDGTLTVVATPHLRHDFPAVRVEELADRCAAVQARLNADRIALDVLPGAEIDYEWAQAASSEELRLASYGQRGTDVLLETPYAPLTPAFEGAVFRLASMGLRVLLAHPERNPTFQKDHARLAAVVGRGALIQLTAASLAEGGRRRRPSARLATWLVERGLAHVVASDAHTAAASRGPDLSRGVAAAERIARGRGEWMVNEAAAAILAGEPLPAAPSGRRGRAWRPRVSL